MSVDNKGDGEGGDDGDDHVLGRHVVVRTVPTNIHIIHHHIYRI